jgi:hypothetical protein
MALETAIIPYTLPSSTNPPPAFILFNSESLSGLWSFESSVTLPYLFTKIALESPAFEQYIVSYVIKHTQDVQPALNGTDFNSFSSEGSNLLETPLIPGDDDLASIYIYLILSYPSSLKSK